MNNRMVIRVLQIGMSPYYGGTESFVMNLYRAIDKTKVQFDFLNVYNEKIACQDEIESMGGAIYYLDMARHGGIRDYHKRIDDFFKMNAHNFDVVHCNYQSLINIDILKYAKKYNISVRIAHAHNAGYGKKINWMQKLLICKNRLMLNTYANTYFACSTLAASWMFGREAIVIHNAIDSEKFRYSEKRRLEMRKKLKVENDFVIIFVGRLDPQKNPLFLLEIFAEIKKVVGNAKLLIVGDGILKDSIRNKIEALGIGESVMMLGTRSDIDDLLQAADIFLLPSIFEGLGIVLIEAQASGIKAYTSKKVVPDEAKITDLLEFVSLDNSAEEWAKVIINNKMINHRDTKDEICAAGYDNYFNAVKMQGLYQNLVEEKS